MMGMMISIICFKRPNIDDKQSHGKIKKAATEKQTTRVSTNAEAWQ